MVSSGNWLVVQQLVKTLVFKLVLLVWRVIQRINWQLNGTERQRREAQHPNNYDRCAQVLDVVMIHKFCGSQALSVDGDFLLTHNRFESPQYVIDNDHITLMEVNDKFAVFSEPREKGMYLWKVEYSAFIRAAQMDYTQRVIVVPLAAFHTMAETIGDPKAEIVFLLNQGRCGSTLFTQIMECTGRCVTLSEPDGPNLVAQKYRQYGDTAEVRRAARDITRWMCRPYPSMKQPPLAYVIKPTATSAVIYPMLRQIYPSIRCIYMYREIIKMSKSLYRMSYGLPMVRLMYTFGRLSSAVPEQIANMMGLAGADLRARLENDLTLGVVVTIVTHKVYLDMRREGVDVRGLRYEDLIAKPHDTCRAILEFCGLPLSLTESAVKGLEIDSQRNTPIGKSVIGSLPEPELTPAMKASFNERLRKHGLPLIGEEGILEGTLTHC